MQILFALVVLAIAAAAVVYAVVTTQRRKGAPAAGPRSVRNLKVGDIVRYRMLPENNFTVTGFIDYREDGYTWREVRLVDGQVTRWLSIEEEDFELELVLWKEVELDTPLQGEVPRQLEFGGQTYRLQESGVARASLTGQTGSRQELQCRYWDFQAVGGTGLLSVEQWGGEYEVCWGERIRESDLDIFAP